jgi:hypothetical protein
VFLFHRVIGQENSGKRVIRFGLTIKVRPIVPEPKEASIAPQKKSLLG